ncbi:MAG: response regulator [Deltaproteobacteria bacterium]|jgi:signal transduction histidine kinase/DNA-binding response OmpR family regulator|nr:response regulator [Deltaproteobacteria bacterium]
MSLKIKIFLIIVAILYVVVITIAMAGLYFIRSGIEQTVIKDMAVMRDIADNLVSNEINFLKAQTESTAQRLNSAPRFTWETILKEELLNNHKFLSFSIYEQERMIINQGAPTGDHINDLKRYYQNRPKNESIVTTTIADPKYHLIFLVSCSFGDYILTASLRSDHFSQILLKYQIWDSGSLYTLDEEGVMISNRRNWMIEGRYNPSTISSPSKEQLTQAAFFQTAVSGDKGVGRYTLEGVERIAVYGPISASKIGWALCAAAPLAESPAVRLDKGLLTMTLIFMVIGTAAAFAGSNFVNKQFETINRQNEHLSELSLEAQSSSAAKTNFLANMSHEMRTPLNAIIGFSELLISGLRSQRDLETSLKKIHSSGLILLNIVNDLLDISKVESGRFELIPVEYDMASLINDAISVNLIRIVDKPIDFGLEIDKNLPSRLFGDELRLKQICNNLLSNAFKYTTMGRVDFYVSGRIEGDDVWLTIKVADTGIGIKPSDLAKLFSLYSQVDTKSNRQIEGTGLGLAITKRLVELMDGHIDVESHYGQGTIFTVELKQKFVTSPPISQKVLESLENFDFNLQDHRHSGPMNFIQLPYARVLVVDDVEVNLDVAKGMLEPYGLKVDCVTSGREAIELIKAAKVEYDAIFMDHMMPIMDGLEAVKKIREINSDYAKNVPIIALTANAIVGNEKMFLDNGFQAFLSKPIELRRIEMVLKQFVADKEREKKYCQDLMESYPEPRLFVSSLSETSDKPKKETLETNDLLSLSLARPIEGFELREGLKRFSGNQKTYRNVLKSYVQSVNILLDQLQTPDDQTLKSYHIAVHGVKSTSFGVGAYSLGQMAFELEKKAQERDLEYIKNKNESFLSNLQSLAKQLSVLLDLSDDQAQKQVKEKPDPIVLTKLCQACSAYDMDGVDQAVAELEIYSYSKEPDLTDWLKDMIAQLNFDQVINRLSEITKPSPKP